MRRIPHISVAVLLVSAIAGGALYLVYVRPWVAMPDEPVESIESRWARVEAAAIADAACVRGAEAMADLGADLERCGWEISELVGPGPDGAIPERDPADLPDGAADAVESLVAWHRSGGGLGADPCAVEKRAVLLLHLGRAAAATAKGEVAVERMAAAARLGRDLRRCGTIVEAMSGLTLAGDLLETSKARGARADALAPFRPEEEEVLPAVAREMACGARMVEEAFVRKQDASRAFKQLPLPWYVPRKGHLEREVIVLEQHWADLFEKASAARDLSEMAAALARPERDDLPRSRLVWAVDVPFDGWLERAGEVIAAYDAAAGAEDPPVEER